RKAITARFFFHAARMDPQEEYRTLIENQFVYTHPSSAFSKGSQTALYITTVINPKWLVELAPRFYKYADPTKSASTSDRNGSDPSMTDIMSPTLRLSNHWA
ncbi:unnamed protein product, partial [Musa acuminata subsp. burmannicoides]